ncbi:putative zinc-type alcohol dehydrogenase-like protein YogA [Thalassobacillus devorans]|uniref:Zinc-type alcohol dehydrogenase-like protein YogA n=1 Tax=Thalassobacillus devorans TaxID=279813 RepID=A0ABQ1P007_9BACI|nr:zinc-binding dehydrogenase [Thalassobacillus devorans]NIK28162.1 zinc-binding alcohol dehydrogenase/oxidoreductase [Thalassobacillus devorans]GGC88409.1 putative zinc-type alcohol dehydrogenase-like protein YogA [Thalassobacillus devorans]
MKAIIHQGKEGLEGLSYQDMEEVGPAPGKVKVKLKTAGLNRRDIAVTSRHKPDQPALVLGSDGAGIIAEVGQGVTDVQVGDEVVINPGLGWKENSDAPPEGFEIMGFPDHGTFGEYVVVPSDHVESKPAHLSWEEAGVLPLAALTAYRVIFTRGKVKEGDTVLLPGIGSGVLTFALKFAKALGARVIVTSRSEEKLDAAKELGADRAIPTQTDWNEALKDEQVDLVVESIGRATFDKSLVAVRKGGTVVTFGATTEDEVEIDIRKFFYGQYNLLGSTMGSAEEFKAMLSFIARHDIKPEVDRMFQLAEFKEAFEYLRDTKNFGKIGFIIEK